MRALAWIVGSCCFVALAGCTPPGSAEGDDEVGPTSEADGSGSDEVEDESAESGTETDDTTSTSTTTTSEDTTDDSEDTSGDSGIKFDMGLPPDGGGDCMECSGDYLSVLDCGGQVLEECENGTACDPSTFECLPACDVAETHSFSIGCEYFPVRMESLGNSQYCYAAFVSNPWNVPAHIDLEYAGMPIAVENFAYAPMGVGQNVTYQAYDPDAGIAPGEMVVLFLSGSSGGAPNCPFPSAVPNGATFGGTGFGDAFRVQSDVPVVAYQMNPFGGGSVAVTGASLLIPSSAWHTDYVTANAYYYDLANPSMNVVAKTDGTEVTIWPVTNLLGGGGIPAGAANTPVVFNLDAGEHAQLSQAEELTGSVLIASEPVGVLAGHACLRVPLDVAYCDHAEEMIPPVRALGSQYVGVMHQPRQGEPSIWRIIGAVDGTDLDWSVDVGGPATLDAGQVVEFTTGQPFVVDSQDEDHPFMLMNYMSGSQWNQLQNTSGYGDPEFAISVPTGQYLTRYVFFADPSYPETAITVIRRAVNGQFQDVELDCAGTLGGWTAIGDDYEWTRLQLIVGNFQGVGNCTTGSHEIHSDGSFGLWVWGWGSPETSTFTANVSYGYPGGMNVATINSVNIDPQG